MSTQQDPHEWTQKVVDVCTEFNTGGQILDADEANAFLLEVGRLIQDRLPKGVSRFRETDAVCDFTESVSVRWMFGGWQESDQCRTKLSILAFLVSVLADCVVE